MKIRTLLAGLLLPLAAHASGPSDFARQWTVLGPCATAGEKSAAADETVLSCPGAFALSLDESVYRQVVQPDLGDLAAFNADGEALPFGPMPAAHAPPPSSWRDAAWFALPMPVPGQSQELNLHVTRSATGELSMDATLRRGAGEGVGNFLIDVRAKDQWVEGIAFEFPLDAADFSAQVSVDASDDLQHWRNVLPAAQLAQLRQGGRSLLRRHLEFPPQRASFLRVQAADPAVALPVRSLRLLLHPAAAAPESLRRSRIAADFVRREGRAYVYALPARVPVDRVNIALGDDNAIASFSISAREPGQRDWSYVGQLDAFRLRAAGVALDNEAMEIAGTRRQEWRIEPGRELSRTPVLELSYRPESWILLTHGSPPYLVAAGSRFVRRDDFPLDALVAQVRSRHGPAWQPPQATLGPMQTAGGEAALSAYDPASKRTWLLWGVLLLAAGAIIAMVLRLLRTPADFPAQ